jgi:hypothetical protein
MSQVLELDTLHGVLVAQAVEVEHRHEQMLVEIRIARAVIQRRVSLERVIILRIMDVQLVQLEEVMVHTIVEHTIHGIVIVQMDEQHQHNVKYTMETVDQEVEVVELTLVSWQEQRFSWLMEQRKTSRISRWVKRLLPIMKFSR